jgi:ankyrin repeat protein
MIFCSVLNVSATLNDELFSAIQNGKLGVVKSLLDRGAKVDARDQDKATL